MKKDQGTFKHPGPPIGEEHVKWETTTNQHPWAQKTEFRDVKVTESTALSNPIIFITDTCFANAGLRNHDTRKIEVHTQSKLNLE